MKQYPSIPSTGKDVAQMYIFDKLDGSNLRFEYDHKLGWHKFGTRQQMLLPTHQTFGSAISMFLETFSQPLENVARQQGWTNFTAFCEFWGQQSFAGFHQTGDPKFLSLIDLQVYKRGLIEPVQFLELFDELPAPRFLGVHQWDTAFLETVRTNQLEGISFEGVIGKVGSGHGRLMRKAKTQNWLDAVRQRFDESQALAILRS